MKYTTSTLLGFLTQDIDIVIFSYLIFGRLYLLYNLGNIYSELLQQPRKDQVNPRHVKSKPEVYCVTASTTSYYHGLNFKDRN